MKHTGEIKRKYNLDYYEKNREKILVQKKEYHKNGEHVKELMASQTKKDLAVMYANLYWCFDQITKQVGVTVKSYKREVSNLRKKK